MNKVVINTCYGGFELSIDAVKWLMENAREEIRNTIVSRMSTYCDTMDTKKKLEIVAYDLLDKIKRHDPDLVRCVETLGDKASGSCARLRVCEIDANIYRIDEYDGKEHIITPDLDMEMWTVIE